jgi:hypothetical protein
MPFKLTGKRRASPIDPLAHALNLSFVLHERSTSAAVASTSKRCFDHAARAARLDERVPVNVMTGQIHAPVETWMTAMVGCPVAFRAWLREQTRDASVWFVDEDHHTYTTHVDFFRAPARLVLPDPEARVVAVGALILRPDGKTGHLILDGPFTWPGDQHLVLRSIERIVQAHVDQWLPPRPLWSATAEQLLRDEIK